MGASEEEEEEVVVVVAGWRRVGMAGTAVMEGVRIRRRRRGRERERERGGKVWVAMVWFLLLVRSVVVLFVCGCVDGIRGRGSGHGR